MVLGGLSSALPEATGPAPCYEPPSSLPPITTPIPAAAALIFREEVGKGFYLGCPGPPAPHPSLAGTARPASPKTKCPCAHPSLLMPGLALSATRGEGEEEEEEEGDRELAPRELIAC